MILPRWTKENPSMQERIRIIVKLGRRRDRILESPELDLEALRKLVEDYEKAEMPCAAADLRRRLEWYRERTFSPQSTRRDTKERQKDE